MKWLLTYIQIIFINILLAFLCNAWAAETLHPIIYGIHGETLNNVQSRLNLVKESYGKELSDNDIQDFLQHAPEEIRQALQPFGYFKTEINSKLTQKNSAWYAIFTIHPGPPLRITHLDLKLTGPGRENMELQKTILHFPIKTGQILRTDVYEKNKEHLFQAANNQGYLKAFLETKEIRIDLKKYTAEIILHLNTGPRYYFGHTSFCARPYAPQFLKRFSLLQENTPFSSEKLLKFEEDLRSSRYFKQVDVTPDFNNTDNLKVPIIITASPPKSQRYDIGIGYGTFTGPRFTLGTDFRRVTDTGQRLTTQLKLSSVLSELNAKYYIPGNNPLTDQYTLGGNVLYFSPKNGTSFSQTLSGSYIKSYEEWQQTFSLSYLNERYRVSGKPRHISQVFYPGWTIARMKADNPLFPRFGSMFNFKVQAASVNVLSRTNFFQTEIKGKYIFSPTSVSRIVLRGNLGYTVVEDLNLLPLTLRFFAGGLGSVRGYPYASIGPGRYLEVASAEYQHKIYKDCSGAVFYDVGNASDVFNGAFKRGAGVGIIYQSFIGPIQLYVGRALSKPGKPFNVEFSIGPDF